MDPVSLALDGHVWRCDNGECNAERYAYHSCRNRSCPKCHWEQTERWLALHRARQPSCPDFLLTVTLPAELRGLARSHHRVVLGALCRSVAAAVLKLCRDEAFLGARPAILVLLHTWTRDLRYHPHVHLLVSAGGLDESGHWVATRHADYLAPAKALAIIIRAKMRHALRQAGLHHQAAPSAWKKPWILQCQHAGNGDKVLDYLAHYVFRVAITNSRIEAIDESGVTFRYRDRSTGETKHCTLPPFAFIARFLQHVLPKGFAKIRSYGLLAPRHRRLLKLAHAQLGQRADAPPVRSTSVPSTTACQPAHRCPACGVGMMHRVQALPPRRGPP
ncbi:MAG: transposase [Acidobacteriota bacterium]